MYPYLPLVIQSTPRVSSLKDYFYILQLFVYKKKEKTLPEASIFANVTKCEAAIFVSV